jgi:hypothetical protein
MHIEKFGSFAIDLREGVSEEDLKEAVSEALRDLGHVTFLYVGDDNPPPQPPPPKK